MIHNFVNDEVQEILDQSQTYTADQILSMVHKSDLDIQTRGEIGSFIDGALQCMYNMLTIGNFEHKDQSALINNPDFWETGYNAILNIFQKEYPHIPKEHFEKIHGVPFDDTKKGGR